MSETSFTIYPEQLNQLNQLIAQFQAFETSAYFKQPQKPQFIWQHAHSPKLTPDHSLNLIKGKLNYGHSIQDEWFLVWSLYQLSINNPSILISINDNDGEFLLIEAADHLPSWITPDLADGRVWIKSGSLHLIPLDHLKGSQYKSAPLPIPTALSIIRYQPDQTLASTAINNAIQLRLNASQPSKLVETHLYNTQAYLHHDLAKLLSTKPGLIGLAINAFIEKDPDNFKACQTMSRFPPGPIESENVVPVRMTRPLYAQIMNHQIAFHPPKPFVKSKWFQIDSLDLETAEWKRRMLGMKISCGFEMLYQFEQQRRMLDFKDLFSVRPKAYRGYLDKLRKVGYFQDEIEGSAKWNDLEVKARQNFCDEGNLERLASSGLAENMDSQISSAGVPSTAVKIDTIEPESDEWLNLTEEQLQAFFKNLHDPQDEAEPTAGESEVARSDANKLLSFTQRVESFIEGKGSLEGALHSDDERSSSDSSNDDDNDDSEQEGLFDDLDVGRSSTVVSSKIDPPSWASGNKALRRFDDEVSRKRLERLVAAIDETDWGQKNVDKTSNLTASLSDGAEGLSGPLQTISSAELNYTSSLTALQPTSTSSNPKLASFKPHLVSSPSFARPNKRSMEPLTKESYDGVYTESSCEESEDESNVVACEDEDVENEYHDDKKARKDVIEDVDMDAERDEFLNFARQSLGLSVDQYQAILESRRLRGAYVPPCSTEARELNDPYQDDENELRIPEFKPQQPDPKGKSKAKNVSFKTDFPNVPDQLRKPNPNLNSFESLMKQMDSELKRHQQRQKGGPLKNSTSEGPDLSGGGVDSDSDDDNENLDLGMISEAMRSELEGLMEDKGVGGDHEQNPDYRQISDFLESLRAQMGGPGPVGNLAGRVGLDLVTEK